MRPTNSKTMIPSLRPHYETNISIRTVCCSPAHLCRYIYNTAWSILSYILFCLILFYWRCSLYKWSMFFSNLSNSPSGSPLFVISTVERHPGIVFVVAFCGSGTVQRSRGICESFWRSQIRWTSSRIKMLIYGILALSQLTLLLKCSHLVSFGYHTLTDHISFILLTLLLLFIFLLFLLPPISCSTVSASCSTQALFVTKRKRGTPSLSTHPINTPCQYTPTTHPINTPY